MSVSCGRQLTGGLCELTGCAVTLCFPFLVPQQTLRWMAVSFPGKLASLLTCIKSIMMSKSPKLFCGGYILRSCLLFINQGNRYILLNHTSFFLFLFKEVGKKFRFFFLIDSGKDDLLIRIHSGQIQFQKWAPWGRCELRTSWTHCLCGHGQWMFEMQPGSSTRMQATTQGFSLKKYCWCGGICLS